MFIVYGESILTGSVHLLDRLFRFAHNLPQKLFDSHVNLLPAGLLVGSQTKMAPLRMLIFVL